MAFCDQCGKVLPSMQSWCANCGARLDYSVPESTASIIQTLSSLDRQAVIRYGSIGLAVLCVAVIAATAVMANQSTSPGAADRFALALFLLFAPLLGSIVVAAKLDFATNWLTRLDRWIDAKRHAVKGATGWFKCYVVGPALWSFGSASRVVGRISDDSVRGGVKLAIYVYLIEAFLFLLYVVTVIVVSIIIIGLVLAVAGAILSEMGERSTSTVRYQSYVPAQTYDEEPSEDAPTAAVSRGATLYSGSNWLNEEKTGRVDEGGNIYKGSNWFNEEKTGRVDEDGNIYKGSNSFSEEKTGRVDKDGNVYKGSNWFNEEKVGRVDEDGNVFKGSNWLTEEKVGRVKKEEK